MGLILKRQNHAHAGRDPVAKRILLKTSIDQFIIMGKSKFAGKRVDGWFKTYLA